VRAHGHPSRVSDGEEEQEATARYTYTRFVAAATDKRGFASWVLKGWRLFCALPLALARAMPFLSLIARGLGHTCAFPDWVPFLLDLLSSHTTICSIWALNLI
jgi:hypothetical protein